ncbi:MAG: hypothetical protein PG978_001293 [Wolbachia endosymbiont of Ctenocephalides felis wCfeF]|nr:MAG: hypothetical protein PG978_001293 [Wolbachia endosymbiont of Ctenocephalides felis wCfeF]
MAYTAKPISAAETAINTPIPSGVDAKATSGARTGYEDAQYGDESATAAPMTYREVSATSAVFILWN